MDGSGVVTAVDRDAGTVTFKYTGSFTTKVVSAWGSGSVKPPKISVSTFSIKGLGFKIEPDWWGGGDRVNAWMDVPVIDERGRIIGAPGRTSDVHAYRSLPPEATKTQIAEAVYSALLELVTHELDEHFTVNGVRTKNPHADPQPIVPPEKLQLERLKPEPKEHGKRVALDKQLDKAGQRRRQRELARTFSRHSGRL